MDAFGKFPLSGSFNPQPKDFRFLRTKMDPKFDKRQGIYFVSVIMLSDCFKFISAGGYLLYSRTCRKEQ